ncbi:MAG: cyclic pyranopterin monophosphate synthase MoaC [Spirochaetales bacterium]|nr:MAG: cyclic pyranopterin monophosphate synthase MoaC [Spirochaetales bacterium]
MLSHIDENGMPGMVDVGGKNVTTRSATAVSSVILPAEVMEALSDGEIHTAKGPVIQTAIIAGTMGAKQTSSLIPLCHPIPINGIDFSVKFTEPDRLEIFCTVSARHVTGVEMEALTGASVAALTVYDMCKAVSKGIVIAETRLVEKHGGKSDYVAP